LGFSQTSSFTATFRKATGLTPTAYHRSVGYRSTPAPTAGYVTD
jgi:AraC-like DNA-binding protein